MRTVVHMAAAMLGAVLAWGTGVHTASAQAHLPGDPYFRPPASDIDPSVMAIDEISVLGNKIDAGTEFVDDKGNTVRWDAMLGKPFILVLSYYTCDGSCSVINATLAGLLKDVKAVKAGEDFRILTVSFDKNDNLKTAAAFRDKLSLPENIAKAWTIATFKNENDLKVQTGKIGFKFFWSPQDNAFLHPGAYLFFSPEGKLSRVLYQQDLSSRDVELAILDANLEHIRPTNIGNLVLSLCYSYNFKAGKYQLNIPFYVGVGALSFGLLTMFGSVLFYKIRGKGRVMKGANNAQVA